MKSKENTGTPNFYFEDLVRAEPLPIGQLYWPTWEDYENLFQDIFNRQYYTNHGPLVQKFEERLSDLIGVKHAICVSNATIGLIMVAEALGLEGKVITPGFTFIATAQSLLWTGLEPVFCDVDAQTHQISTAQIEKLMTPEVSAILAVNLWGDCCDIPELERIARKHQVHLFFDSAHALGCVFQNKPIGNYGEAEIFSFHATKILSSAEGGCITTNDDALAAKLRNIRSSYGAGPAVSIIKTSNGRMSEAHAAIGLYNLDRLLSYVERNREIFNMYRQGLEGIHGLNLYAPSSVDDSNFQYVVCKISTDQYGLDRDELIDILHRHNIIARRYFYPGVHRSTPFAQSHPEYLDRLPVTDTLSSCLLQLPTGALVKNEDVEHICQLIRRVSKAGMNSR